MKVKYFNVTNLSNNEYYHCIKKTFEIDAIKTVISMLLNEAASTQTCNQLLIQIQGLFFQ